MIKQTIGRTVVILGNIALILINLIASLYLLLLLPMIILISLFCSKEYFIELTDKYRSNIPIFRRSKSNEIK